MALRPSTSQDPEERQGRGVDQRLLVDTAVEARGRVKEEQLRIVWAHVQMAAIAASLFAVALCVALRREVGSVMVVNAWLAAKLAVAALRMVQGWRFGRQARPHPNWARWTLWGLVADALVWGVAALYIVLTAPWPLASFIGAVMACLTCVATFGLQASARFTASYAIPILAPTALGLFLRDESFGRLGSIGMVILLALQLVTALRSQRRLEDSILLRLQAETLAHDKAEALKAAMRQSAVRTQFLANISHELRTPLHGILGMASLLQPAMRDPVHAQRLALIASSGTHLLALINDLLDLSRIDAGHFLIRREVHDLAAQVEQLAGIYATRCEEKGLSFAVYNTLSSPCWVWVDPARFRQVLHNLLGNAVKFTEKGGVTLTVSRDEAGDMVRVEVTDTGPGIPPADLGRVFEAFQQADAGTMLRTSEGAGLGLTIARDIARAMEGDITAISEPGRGARLVFTARLTAAPAPEMAGSEPPTSAPLPDATVPHPPPCRVLLAEDNEINALVAENFLMTIGVDFERVANGAEAVEAALREHDRPDLVLMDCQMPVMNGYDAARTIRDGERTRGWPRVPILALTATASDAEQQNCLDAGMDAHLSKPCTLETLRDAIARWVPAQAVRPPRTAAAQEKGEEAGLWQGPASSASPQAPLPT